MKIPVYKPTISAKEKENVLHCLDTEWVSSRGEFVNQFENDFGKYIDCDFAISINNGTAALHTALLALGVGPGDEVIVPTLTYIASANAVTYTGATPVFVDSTSSTWQMCPVDILRAISPKTRAIMPVHLYGQPCDMQSICSIAEEHDLLVIEDCAEAIGTRIGGRHVGTFGDIGIFSFYGNKTITTGEGGMVVTRNPTSADRTSHLKGQGLAKFREYWHDIIGYNYRMTNICAAIGCGQLERIDSILERKKQLAEAYRKRLSQFVTFQSTTDGTTHSHWMVCFLVPQSSMRDRLRAVMEEAGIETRPVFYPVHSMPMYARSYRRMPIAERIASCGINLPSYPELTESQIDYICDIIKEFFAK
jgi:perosamine synthetase